MQGNAAFHFKGKLPVFSFVVIMMTYPIGH
jgi:hypothetical protein